MIAEAYAAKTQELQTELETIKYRLQLQKHSKENLSSAFKHDWRRTYEKFRNYEDEEELEETVKRLEDCLKQTKKKRTMIRNPCCSNDRSEEFRVASLSLKKRIEEMGLYRAEGNRCYKDQNFEAALKYYEKSLLFSEYALTDSDVLEEQRFQEEKVSSLLNCAACHMARNDFAAAISYCDEVLILTEGKNFKALYRLCKCHRKLMNFKIAQRHLQNLLTYLEVHPSPNPEENILIKKEEFILKKAVCKYQQNSKIMAMKMIQNR